jgi:hypothetical protein
MHSYRGLQNNPEEVKEDGEEEVDQHELYVVLVEVAHHDYREYRNVDQTVVEDDHQLQREHYHRQNERKLQPVTVLSRRRHVRKQTACTRYPTRLQIARIVRSPTPLNTGLQVPRLLLPLNLEGQGQQLQIFTVLHNPLLQLRLPVFI